MKLARILIATLAVFGSVSLVGVVLADHHEGKPKHTTKEVMKQAHKDGLLKKVVAGEASQEEKLLLLDLYVSLIENEPPKGSMDSWQALAGRSALAAAKVAVGREGATVELKEATNCKACHEVHKGK